jgi:hypothetical protein
MKIAVGKYRVITSGAALGATHGASRRARRFWAVALLLPGLLAGAAWGQTRAAQASPPNAVESGRPLHELAEGARCGSVVIRHCRWRRESSSSVLDPSLRGRNGAPMQWEVVQYGGPDNDEIVVTGERIRDPGIQDVFERTFGTPRASTSMNTRVAAAGARCTVIERTGASLCSNSGAGLPALDNPLTDWTF